MNVVWHWIQGVLPVLIQMVVIAAQVLRDVVLMSDSVNRISPDP